MSWFCAEGSAARKSHSTARLLLLLPAKREREEGACWRAPRMRGSFDWRRHPRHRVSIARYAVTLRSPWRITKCRRAKTRRAPWRIRNTRADISRTVATWRRSSRRRPSPKKGSMDRVVTVLPGVSISSTSGTPVTRFPITTRTDWTEVRNATYCNTGIFDGSIKRKCHLFKSKGQRPYFGVKSPDE